MKKVQFTVILVMFMLLLVGLMKVDGEMKATLLQPTVEYIPVIEYVPTTQYITLPSKIYGECVGEFEVTYYTAGVESTGKTPSHPAYGITKSGARVEEGVTVAVDPNVIPLGTYLYIEGIGFRVAQDTGGAIKGNKIDIYVPDVKTALEGGRHKSKVYVLREDE